MEGETGGGQLSGDSSCRIIDAQGGPGFPAWLNGLHFLDWEEIRPSSEEEEAAELAWQF